MRTLEAVRQVAEVAVGDRLKFWLLQKLDRLVRWLEPNALVLHVGHQEHVTMLVQCEAGRFDLITLDCLQPCGYRMKGGTFNTSLDAAKIAMHQMAGCKPFGA